MATTPPQTPGATRRPAPRGNKNTALIVGIVIAVVLVILIVLGFSSCGGDDKKPAAGSSGAVTSSAQLLGKGLTEIQQGNLDQAKSDLDQAAALNPQNKYAFYNLGYIAQTRGDKAEAEKQYKAALAIDPKFDSALYNEAIIRAGENDIGGAIVLYRRAIASNASDANAHFNLGLLLRQTGKTPEGNSQVQTAVQLAPSLAAAASAQGVPSASR